MEMGRGSRKQLASLSKNLRGVLDDGEVVDAVVHLTTQDTGASASQAAGGSGLGSVTEADAHCEAVSLDPELRIPEGSTGLILALTDQSRLLIVKARLIGSAKPDQVLAAVRSEDAQLIWWDSERPGCVSRIFHLTVPGGRYVVAETNLRTQKVPHPMAALSEAFIERFDGTARHVERPDHGWTDSLGD